MMSPELVVVRTRKERQLFESLFTCSFEDQYTVPSKCQAVRAKELDQTSLASEPHLNVPADRDCMSFNQTLQPSILRPA
jgi:hypothetical protein